MPYLSGRAASGENRGAAVAQVAVEASRVATLPMMNARHLLTPRWLIAHAVVLLVAVVCVILGLWQLDRHGEEQEALSRLEDRLGESPVALDTLAAGDVDDTDAIDLEYRPVTVTGTYEPEDELLVRSQAYQGTSGYHVLTPLKISADEAVLVNRGWVPFELDEPPITAALPPGGVVEVSGFLERSQVRGDGFGPRDPAEGRLERVFFKEISRIRQQVDYQLFPMLVQLQAQRPEQTGRLPIAAPPPEFDPSQNLSYAAQWFSFAGIALIGYGALLYTRTRKEPERLRENIELPVSSDV